MAEEVISVTGIAEMGVVKDSPPIALAPNVFTDVKNVRFRDGAVTKISGEVLLNNITEDLVPANETFGKIRYIASWENPNVSPNAVYYIFVVDYIRANVTVGQKIYIQDHLGNKKDLTPDSLPDGFTYTPSEWQHTLFAGGFAFIINNGLNHPQYILDTPGNTDINNIVLADLPGWDLYSVEQTAIEDTWNTNDSYLFDTGQKIDFAINELVVTVNTTTIKAIEAGTPAGTGTPGAIDFVPGALPSTLPTVVSSKYQVYIDEATNTTVVYTNALNANDVVKVLVRSRNTVTTTAGIIESFGDLLVAGDLTERDSVTNVIVRRLSGVVRTSDVAVPGAVPNNWNPNSAGVSTADEFTLSETNTIEDMKSLQGNMYIFSTDSIHVMRITGNTTAPVSFSPVTDEYGCLNTGSVIEYDGRLFIVGSNDIYAFAGNPGDIKSLADGRVSEYFFKNINPIHDKQLFLTLNHQENEIWVNYPTLASLAGECDEALIWNYRDNTWTIRELNSVMSGAYAPIKGGGIPTATVALDNNSGNAGYSNTGLRESQVLTINGKTPKKTIGTKAIKTVAVSAFSDFTTDVQEIVDLTVTGDTGPNTVNAVSTLVFPSTTFTYDRNQATYLDGGASAIINGDTSIGNVSFPAIAVLGTGYADGATITMTQFVAAVRDYINANNSLSDWTASASTNTLTLTSDVPGPRVFSVSTFAVSGGATSNLTINPTVTGVGVYGITAALSPAISMTITAPAVAGIHAAINETITLTKNLTSQTAIRDDIIVRLSLLAPFNGSSSAIYSTQANGNNIRFTSVLGGNNSALTITFKTTYISTDYSETTFGGNLTASVVVVTAGVNNGIPKPVLTVTFPDGTTSSEILTGTETRATVNATVSSLINANSGWSTVTGTNIVTATAAAIGIINNNFSVAITSTGTLPPGFSSSNFTYAQTRAGVAQHDTTDRITITPPQGTAVTVNFDSTAAFDPDSGSSPTNVAEITAIEIATALQAAWTDTTYFTVARTNAILTFTSVDRDNPAGVFNYTVVNGDSRTGTLVTPLVSDASAVVTEGVDPIFAKMTRVTITLQTLTGDNVIFDRHYGEGPGRLLDPDFTPAANDSTYGDTSATTDAEYLNLYYDPDKDPARTNTTEQAKPNGTIADLETAMLAALTAISGNQTLIVTPDSSSAPTEIVISPSQFSSTANYVKSFSPATQVVTASVAPTVAALIAVAEGNTVATSAPTQDTTGTTISTTFDIERPWSSLNVNPNRRYPVFAQSGFTDGVLFNRIRAADVGTDFAGTPYVSYAERIELSIAPNFDTETLNSIALWADGGTVATVGGVPQRATLQLRARATNYPGEIPYLTTPEDNTQTDSRRNKLVVNDYVVADTYKTDIRLTGRFINYRIDDANADVSSGYTGTNVNQWRVSGLQLGVNKGGVK